MNSDNDIIYIETDNVCIQDNEKQLLKDFLKNLVIIGKSYEEVREIYDIIESLIDSYFAGYMQTYEFDQQTYDNIFNILIKYRTKEIVLNKLKTILLREKYI